MTNPAKAKGSQWERDLVAYFRENGFAGVERAYGAGRPDDRGDLAGFRRRLVVEAKNHQRIDLSTIMDETEREATSALADCAVAIIKRRRRPVHDAYCVMSLGDLVQLLDEAGY